MLSRDACITIVWIRSRVCVLINENKLKVLDEIWCRKYPNELNFFFFYNITDIFTLFIIIVHVDLRIMRERFITS